MSGRAPQLWLDWWTSQRPVTQAVIPGGYAWAVTIAPVGMARGGGSLSLITTLTGLAALIAGPAIERRSTTAARVIVGWGLVASAIATWCVTPETVMAGFDAARGLAGMFGWGLFAFAIASPARRPLAPVTRSADQPPPRSVATQPIDRAVLAMAIGIAVALQIPGWHVEQRDRALLLRLVALAAGLGLVTSASTILVRYHSPEMDEVRPRAHARGRMRAGDVAWLVGACILVGTGAGYQLLWRH